MLNIIAEMGNYEQAFGPFRFVESAKTGEITGWQNIGEDEMPVEIWLAEPGREGWTISTYDNGKWSKLGVRPPGVIVRFKPFLYHRLTIMAAEGGAR